MAIAKLVNLFVLSSLAILVCSFGASPVSALTDSHMMRARGHDSIAKHKRASSTKRCKPRPTSSTIVSASTKTSPTTTSSLATVTPTPTHTSTKPSSTSAPAPTSSAPSSPPSTGKKVGTAWANGNSPSLANFKSSHTQFLYTWDSIAPTNAAGLGFNFMPMLWSNAADKVANFQKLVVKGYATHAMGFNECNEPGQSNMSPQVAADAWKQYIQPLSDQGYQLLAPSTSSNPNGKTWTTQFFSLCTGCTFDGIPIHYYDVTPQGFINYVTDFHTTFGLPIWPTEFACQNFNNGPQCSVDQVWNFYSTIIKFMEETDWIIAYFAFGEMENMQGVNTDNQLMDSNGNPTPLGSAYLDVNWS